MIFGLIAPLIAAAPVTKLPGVVDAGSYQHPRHPAPPTLPPADAKVFDMLQALNQIPEDQLNEKTGAAAPVVEELRAADGPEFSTTKRLLGRTDVRKSLNPGAKCILAGLVSPRADAFVLGGNLWLAGLQSANPDLRARARQRLPWYIQSAHIPVLINLLKVPGPNVLAFEVLQDVTGQTIEPNLVKWGAWWKKTQGHFDLVGYLLNQTRMQLAQMTIRGFDQAQFWYAPEGVDKTTIPYAQRSIAEQNAIRHWSDWARADVAHYVEQWDSAKPIFERIVHQPDKRVSEFLRSLTPDPGLGDYASIILAWRGDVDGMPAILEAYKQNPTVGRALARGTLGDKTALIDILRTVQQHKAPLAYPLMDNTTTPLATRLPALGIVSAEQAFELLAHQRFGLAAATTARDKRKASKKANRWLRDNLDSLRLDRKRGYYVGNH